MLKRTLTTWIAATLTAALLIQPLTATAGAKEDIAKQLSELRKQEQKTAEQQKAADQKAAGLKKEKQQQVVSLNDLQTDIKTQGDKLEKLETKITETSLKLQQTGEQLEEAQDRVAKRDTLLKSRVRMMYMKGSVSYLDVLLSATSFSDFIDRFDSIKALVGQDKKILAENKKDRNEIAAMKKDVEAKLADVKDMYADAEDLKASLMDKEKRVKAVIASLSQEEAKQEDISEESEASLVALAKQKQQLYTKQQEIIAKEKAEEEKRKKAAAAAAAAAAAKGGGNKTVASSHNGQMLWPVPSSDTISSTFGYRVDPIAGVRKLHKGVDIAAPRGTKILAADDGVVLIASWVRGYGNCIVIDHGDGVWTWYGHIMEGGIYVSEGDTVKRGQVIAGVGSTGDSTGNHLHFEVRINENPVNPLPYIQ
ncbi:murein hydrolase activator EnvC family protein [Gorillibacterium timonense]|uniref:murein hydrolase activator EnvC family protein n=1 Tax=Gorillibacterium timonense TaxID=1689269 RepID=UPI00071C96A9|nr:peptidoglycan DD-metalloendopeptidase family protein [Gorillibacterium timonense]